VVETDIANCFEAIPSDKLMRAIEERVYDQSVLRLLRAMLRAGVMVDGQVNKSQTGTPQGGVISPLLCNVYLHQVDRIWQVREHGVLVRYCDDAVVMCRSREQAEAALARLREVLADLGMELKDAKTRIVHLKLGGEGLTFLGFDHRMVRSPAGRGKRQVTFLARWPSDKAMQGARDRLRELTARSRLRIPVETVVTEMNMFLRGWAAYFRYGNSAARFAALQWYASMRLGLFLSKRYRRSRGFGRWLVGVRQPAHLRLVSLGGIVVAPRPYRPWRGKTEYRR
jgi:RNA-directed DNA polymerase